MSDGDHSRLEVSSDDILTLARELTDAAAEFRAVRSNSSITVHAGGLTSALAICISLSAVVVMVLFGCWVMWQVSGAKAQQEAWIQVWQQRIANELRKDNAN